MKQAARDAKDKVTGRGWEAGLRPQMLLVLKFFALAYSALFPVINPLGSALMFLTVVGSVPNEQFRYLARKVSVCMVLFLLVFEVRRSCSGKVES